MELRLLVGCCSSLHEDKEEDDIIRLDKGMLVACTTTPTADFGQGLVDVATRRLNTTLRLSHVFFVVLAATVRSLVDVDMVLVLVLYYK
jgi:hypothetical protein